MCWWWAVLRAKLKAEKSDRALYYHYSVFTPVGATVSGYQHQPNSQGGLLLNEGNVKFTCLLTM